MGWESDSLTIIIQRARKDPRYVAAVDAAFREVDALRLEERTVEEMRELGGMTGICRAALLRQGDDSIGFGSKMRPYTLTDALRNGVTIDNVRSRASLACANRRAKEHVRT